MAIEITPKGPFPKGKTVPLEAKTASAVSGWQWASSSDKGSTFTDINGATTNTFELDVTAYSGKTLRVTATLASGGTETDSVVVTPAPETEKPVGNGAGNGPPEPPSIWHSTFANVSGVVAAVLLVVLILMTDLDSVQLGLTDTSYAKLDGRALVGSAVIGPITLVGVVVTVVGVWMVAVEWRGRFVKTAADARPKSATADLTQLLTALGKLRGATLVLLSGVAILLGVAFMTSSTVGADPASSTSSPTSTTPPTDAPAGTTEPTPTG